jgi:hypothetical protein
MAPAIPAPGQGNLLEWAAPQPVVAFDPMAVRGATLPARLSRAISVALSECGLSREDVAARMSAFLGESVTENMLNAYASGAREKHSISLPRFCALLAVTGDRRLLEHLAADMGWAVIERRMLPMIELAALHESEARLKRRKDEIRRRMGSLD